MRTSRSSPAGTALEKRARAERRSIIISVASSVGSRWRPRSQQPPVWSLSRPLVVRDGSERLRHQDRHPVRCVAIHDIGGSESFGVTTCRYLPGAVPLDPASSGESDGRGARASGRGDGRRRSAAAALLLSTLFLLAACGQPAPAPPSLSPRPSSPLAQRPSAPVSTAPTTGVLLDEDFGGSRL